MLFPVTFSQPWHKEPGRLDVSAPVWSMHEDFLPPEPWESSGCYLLSGEKSRKDGGLFRGIAEFKAGCSELVRESYQISAATLTGFVLKSPSHSPATRRKDGVGQEIASMSLLRFDHLKLRLPIAPVG